jgi:hypothetical protein
LRDFKKTEVKDQTLIVHFRGKKEANIALHGGSTDLLQGIKEYIEEAAK